MLEEEGYFDTDEFRELLEQYEEAAETGDRPFMDVDDLADLADYYTLQGDSISANEVIDHALSLYPSATLPNVFKAREAIQEGDFEKAHAHAQQIEEQDDPDYHYLLAEIWIAEGNVAKADKYLREYSFSVPSDEYQDFTKDCANLFIDYGLSDKANEWLMRCKGDDSNDFKELMARICFSMGKYEDTERIFNELIDRDPYSKYYWNALASTQFMREDYNSAVTSSEYAIAIDPHDPEGLLSKANGLFHLNNYEEALNYYRSYQEIIPDDEFSLLHQAFCLVNLGRQQEAVELLEQALKVAPEDSPFLVQIYQELAFTFSALKKPRKALSMLDKTDTLECDHSDVMVIRGHILLENGLVKEAEEAFKAAIRMSENAPGILLRIIVSLYDNHYVEACYHIFKKFFNIIQDYDDNFLDGYAYMALCCYDLGKEKEFLRYLRKSANANPKETRVVLGFLFPPDMDVKDYYSYMKEKIEL